MQKFKFSGSFLFISCIAVLTSFFLHELAHLVAGELLGYKMGMSWNKTFFLDGQQVSSVDDTMVSAAGPFFTILQAFIFYTFLRKYKNAFLYPFLLMPLYMRLLAGVLNFINLNDEGRIGKTLGIGIFTLSIIICALLFYLVYKISVKYKYSFKFQMLNLLLIMFFSSILILSDQYFQLKIIN